MATILRRGERQGATFASDAFTRIDPGRWEPGLLRCDCGAEIEMGGPGEDVECDQCGREFNSGGQELAPREHWGEETGEHWTDIVRPGDPFD